MANPLHPHQLQAVAAALPALEKYGGFYCAHGVGSGKSLTAITIAKLLHAQRILVVVGPVVALGVWRLELAKWWPEEYARFVTAHDKEEGVIVINVDKLDAARMKWFLKWKPDLLIFDESHYLASPSAQRTRKVWKLRAASKYFIALSGTPVHNVLGYWSQYRMIEPGHPLWSSTFGQYKEKVAKFKGPDGNWFDGPKPHALEAISRITAPYTHWFDTKDLELPEPIYTEVPVTLYEEERKAYAQMDHDFRADMATDKADTTSASTALVKAMRLHQLSSGHARTDLGADVFVRNSAKLDTLLELLRDRVHLKVIVVCRFLAEIERIKEEALRFWPRGPGQQTNVNIINGETKAIERDNIVAGFQGHPMSKLLLIQPKSGGIAATMTAADCLINYSFEPSSIVWRQTIGRVWRMGQTGHVQILSLVAENTVDKRLYDGLQRGLEDNDLSKYICGEEK